MIIIIENKEDKIALAKTYEWIEEQVKIQENEYIDTTPIYNALIVNKIKETTAQ